jgi:lactoylglutathione lyase
MISPQGLFEAHLTVADLDRAVEFYRNVVGLRLAHITPARDAAFFWIDGDGHTMLGLWKAGVGPQRMSLHTAFRVSLQDVLEAPSMLREAGVEPLDFHGRRTDEPSVIAWMPAASVFFYDPDGHLLEFITMLSDPPRPELGVMSWREWPVSDGPSERTRGGNRDSDMSDPG